MSDETIGPSPAIGTRAPQTSDRIEFAPTVAGEVTDPGLATGAFELPSPADDPPATVHATGTVDPGQSNGVDATGVFDATSPQSMDATADATLSSQSDAAPTGAFAATEGATGAFDPINDGANGARLAATEVATRDMPSPKQRKPADSDGPKARCGNYVLKKFFAKGGMGEVWLAEDPVIGRSVALKRMLGKRSDQQVRFRVEAQITGQLEHPGIVPVHELGSNADGEPYYVMKFVEGRTLQKVIQEFHDKKLTGGAREVEQLKLLQMFLALCQTVGYAHSRGVLHRDLKPENVMLGPFGETILLDWGIAKVLGQNDPVVSDEPGPAERLPQSIPDTETHAGAIMGTPSYMAPEVAAGLNEEVDERSDIYLLGGTLYQMLSGRQPRSAKTMAEIIKKAKQEPPKPVRTINPLVPKALEAICLKSMAHTKADRYQTATALAEDIQRFVAGEPVSAYREGFPARAWRWAKRNRRALGLSAAAVLIGSVALVAAIKVREAEQRRAVAVREAGRLKAEEKARVDLKQFRHLADEANFFAATTNPASEHAPYFDPHKGGAMSRAALTLARTWGPDLELLPLPEEHAAVKNELYDLLILTASETLRAEPGHAAASQALATLDRARAARSDGSSVSDFRLRARAYEQLGDEKQAAGMRLRADDPKTPRTALDLVLLGERERDESAARVGDQTDRKPWQLDPDRMTKAIAFYRQALAIDPDHFWSRLQLGRCLQTLGRFPEAAEALGACIAIRPKAPWGYSALALALAEQGRYDEAEHALNQAIGIDADALPPRLHRGVVYWRQKKYDLAVADFEAVLAPPDDKRLVEAAYYRGQLYLERGEVQKALDDFDRVVAATPGFRSVYLDRPLIYLSKGDAPRALADLDTYVSLVRKIDPDGWEIHGLRGRLLRFLCTELPQEKRRGPTGRAMSMAKGTTADRPRLAGMKFLVEEILGTDNDGKVMKIGDQGDVGKHYALKVVSRDNPEDDARLARCQVAAEASEKLGYPAILKYHDYRDRKAWFRIVRGELLMEYVAGKSLTALTKSLSLGQRILIFKHVAGALAHMHRRGVFHGDISPARVLLASSGAVKVMGYGQSLLKDKKHRTANKQFAAPEQIRENLIDERTEIYGVGSMMYYLLTGKTPNLLRDRSGGDDAAVKLPRPSDLHKKVPAALDDLILACVQRKPEQRPEGMFDVLKALEDLAGAHHLNDGTLKGVAAAAAKEVGETTD